MAPARDLNQLAAQLNRPSTSLAPFAHLEPGEIAVLSEAIEATRLRRREAVEAALAGIAPVLPRGAVIALMRGRLPGLR